MNPILGGLRPPGYGETKTYGGSGLIHGAGWQRIGSESIINEAGETIVAARDRKGEIIGIGGVTSGNSQIIGSPLPDGLEGGVEVSESARCATAPDEIVAIRAFIEGEVWVIQPTDVDVNNV